MEACGANFLDEDWESLGKMFSIEECISYSDETESSLSFLNQQNLSYDHGNNTSEPSMNYNVDDNLNIMSSFFNDLELKPDETCWGNGEHLCLREKGDSINELQQLKRKYVETSPQARDDDVITKQGPRKKARARRNNKSKRMQERDTNEEDTNNNAKGKQSSSCRSLNIDQEDSIPTNNDDNSQEISNSKTKSSLSMNSNGKTRAMRARGSATDSQSLYARKRRERINERLKILQSLVPNGTKVDISTMLEEAVHYVKFLQLQIKLLSSDELWMYAPIAYNGIMDDIGMYQKICPNRWP